MADEAAAPPTQGWCMDRDPFSDGPLDRALAILDFIATQRRSVAIADLADALNLPLPTAHRLVGNLEDRGLVQRSLGSKRLVVGNKLLTLGAKAIGAGFRNAHRHAVLQSVSKEIGEQCEIGVVRDNQVTYVDSVRVTPQVGLQFDPGTAAPIHCTSTGKIFMSQLPPKAREKLVSSLDLHRYTDNTITTVKALKKEIEVTRLRGWAKTNEEFVRGVVGCAVPIVSSDRLLIACLGISVPTARVSFGDLDRFIPPLVEAARRLSETIDTNDHDGNERPKFNSAA
jgi:IclR family transcriptional regulator, acetate operon repressor